jgi:hypothetical protein
MSAAIQERDDVRHVIVIASTDNDCGLGYLIGFDGVTHMKIVKRFGPLDFIPYIEVWRGDRLWAEIPQHNTLSVEFLP